MYLENNSRKHLIYHEDLQFTTSICMACSMFKLLNLASKTLIVTDERTIKEVSDILFKMEGSTPADILDIDSVDDLYYEDYIVVNINDIGTKRVLTILNEIYYYINNVIIVDSNSSIDLDTITGMSIFSICNTSVKILYINRVGKEIDYDKICSSVVNILYPELNYKGKYVSKYKKEAKDSLRYSRDKVTVRTYSSNITQTNIGVTYIQLLDTDTSQGPDIVYPKIFKEIETIVGSESKAKPTLLYVSNLYSAINVMESLNLDFVIADTLPGGAEVSSDTYVLTDDLYNKALDYSDIVLCDIPLNVGVLFEDVNNDEFLFITYVFRNRIKEISSYPIKDSVDNKYLISLIVD